MDKTSCPVKPELLKGKPLGMFHCEHCGNIVIAGLPHPTDKDIRKAGGVPYCELKR